MMSAYKPADWCDEALHGQIEDDKQPLMVYLCSLQAGHRKTNEEVARCAEVMQHVCFDECAIDSDPLDQIYRECVMDKDVRAAYNVGIPDFLTCMGKDTPCLQLQRDWKTGNSCWQRCFRHNMNSCHRGCRPAKKLSRPALRFLHCALEVNDAHVAFRNCVFKGISTAKAAAAAHPGSNRNRTKLHDLLFV